MIAMMMINNDDNDDNDGDVGVNGDDFHVYFDSPQKFKYISCYKMLGPTSMIIKAFNQTFNMTCYLFSF